MEPIFKTPNNNYKKVSNQIKTKNKSKHLEIKMWFWSFLTHIDVEKEEHIPRKIKHNSTPQISYYPSLSLSLSLSLSQLNMHSDCYCLFHWNPFKALDCKWFPRLNFVLLFLSLNLIFQTKVHYSILHAIMFVGDEN